MTIWWLSNDIIDTATALVCDQRFTDAEDFCKLLPTIERNQAHAYHEAQRRAVGYVMKWWVTK